VNGLHAYKHAHSTHIAPSSSSSSQGEVLQMVEASLIEPRQRNHNEPIPCTLCQFAEHWAASTMTLPVHQISSRSMGTIILPSRRAEMMAPCVPRRAAAVLSARFIITCHSHQEEARESEGSDGHPGNSTKRVVAPRGGSACLWQRLSVLYPA
jgi:hypothetical protein